MCTGGHTENARTNSSTSASCQGSNMVYLSSIMCHIMYIHMQILKYGWKNWLSSTQSHRCTSRCQKYNTCGCPPPEFLPRGMMFADNMFADNMFADNMFADNMFADNMFADNMFADNMFADMFADNMFAGTCLMFADMFLFPESAYLNIKTWTSLVPSALSLAPFLSLSLSLSLSFSLSLSLSLCLSLALSLASYVYITFSSRCTPQSDISSKSRDLESRQDLMCCCSECCSECCSVMQWVSQYDVVSVVVCCSGNRATICCVVAACCSMVQCVSQCIAADAVAWCSEEQAKICCAVTMCCSKWQCV